MARLRRIVLAGHPHVVIHRGNNGQDVFLGDDDRESYLAALCESAHTAGVAIHAYSLRPSEVRLLVTPATEDSLGRLMQAVGRRFVPQFNHRHGRSGTPWEGRFRSTVIEAPSHFLACMLYVESGGDPIEQGRSSVVSDKPLEWSSAGQHLSGRSDALLTEHSAFWDLGNTPFDRESAYRRYAAEPQPPQEVATILHATMNGWVLGSDAFVDRVGELAGRRPRRAAPGRPRKHPGANTPIVMAPIK